MGKKRNPFLTLLIFVPLVMGYAFYFPMMAGKDPTDASDAGAILIASLVLFAGLVVFLVLYLMWYARTNRELAELTQSGFKVGLFTFLLVIPIANIVSLYKLSDHVHKAHLMKGVTGIHAIVMFLLLFLVPFVGVPMTQAQVNKVW